MKKVLVKRVLSVIQTILLTGSLWLLTTAIYENSYINSQINQFVSRGVFQEALSTQQRRVYSVSRETSNELKSYEINGPRRAFTGSVQGTNFMFNPGVSGDIMVTFNSPFPDNPLIHNFLGFFTGGHASIVATQWQDNSVGSITENDAIDIAGLEKDPNLDIVSTVAGNFWMISPPNQPFIGLRTVSTEKQRLIAINHAISFLGDRYNHSFIFNTYDRHYCTDKISKAYQAAGINLNHDGFATTVHDIFVSSNTYMFMYRFVENGVDHIYMIDDLFFDEINN